MPDSMIFAGRRGTPLALGAAAAGLALALPRTCAWRRPLAAMAVAGTSMSLLRAPSPMSSAKAGRGAAPELIRSAMIDGILMRWEEHGERGNGGIPVVMVHGIPTNPRIWRYIIPQVAKNGVCCLAWEQVGFGWSLAQGLERDISIPRQAEYLRAWLRHLGIERAVFIGHDVGGGVLQTLLTTHPDLFMGLVLADCVAYDNWPVAAVRTAQALSDVIARLPPALVEPFFLAALADLGHDDPRRRTESAALLWEPYARPIGPMGFANQLRHMSAEDTLAVARDLQHFNGPVRIIWGEKDPLGTWSAERLARALDAPVRYIPGGRHFTPEDHPDVIADELHAVLASVPNGSGQLVGGG